MSLESELATLGDDIDFSGVVALHGGGVRTFELVRGYSDRSSLEPIRSDTRFGVASATKGMTAVTIASLVEAGELEWSTRLREIRPDLVNVGREVTIEQLLSHRSGAGDYVDEELMVGPDDEILTVPASTLRTPDDYLPLLMDHAMRDVPGQSFRYNNSGFVALSLVVEQIAGESFYDVVQQRVLDPAGMQSSGFFASDDRPENVAIGYLANGRTNYEHLPFRGAGDGGMYSTVGDIERFWEALMSGRLLNRGTVDLMTRRWSVVSDERSYGLGFWLTNSSDDVRLEGMDAGVSFLSGHRPADGVGFVVISNTAQGAWPIAKRLGTAFDAMPQAPIVIREAIAADTEAVLACVHAAYSGYVPLLDRQPAPMLDDYQALVGAGVVTVATAADEVVGVIVMWPRDDHLYVDNIAISPAAQGFGTGSSLLVRAEEKARLAGMGEIRLYTNEKMSANVGYYLRRGFVETHRAVDDGYSRVYFSRGISRLT